MKYDFDVIGRWRNRDNVEKVVKAIREAGYSCFSFIENDWSHHESWDFSHMNNNADETMQQVESLSMDALELKEIFDRDFNGLKDSRAVVLVLPSGVSSSIEAGAAYGLGKPVYAVISPDFNLKSEASYLIFNKIFKDVDEFKEFLKEEN